MRDLHSLKIKIDFFAGTSVEDAALDICELANRIGCLVEGTFNGVHLWAKEGSDWRKIAYRYHEEIASDRTVKIAKGW